MPGYCNTCKVRFFGIHKCKHYRLTKTRKLSMNLIERLKEWRRQMQHEFRSDEPFVSREDCQTLAKLLGDALEQIQRQ